MSRRDLRFMRKLVDYERDQLRSKISTAWQQLAYPSHAFAELDYETNPPRLSYGMIKDYTSDFISKISDKSARKLEWPEDQKPAQGGSSRPLLSPRSGDLERIGHYQGLNL